MKWSINKEWWQGGNEEVSKHSVYFNKCLHNTVFLYPWISSFNHSSSTNLLTTIESREVTKVKSEFWPSLRRVEILKEGREKADHCLVNLQITIEPFTDSQLILIYPCKSVFLQVSILLMWKAPHFWTSVDWMENIKAQHVDLGNNFSNGE